MNTSTSPQAKTRQPNPVLPEPIQDLSPEAWIQWRRHPMTRALHLFLRDYRAALLKDHVARFIAGNDDPEFENQARWRAAAILDVLSLDAPTITKFYAPIQEEAARVWTDPMTASLPPDLDQAINEGTPE